MIAAFNSGYSNLPRLGGSAASTNGHPRQQRTRNAHVNNVCAASLSRLSPALYDTTAGRTFLQSISPSKHNNEATKRHETRHTFCHTQQTRSTSNTTSRSEPIEPAPKPKPKYNLYGYDYWELSHCVKTAARRGLISRRA